MDNQNVLAIAARLSEAMKDASDVSQSELARLSGVPQATISRILKGAGKSGPEAGTLQKLAKACKVNFAWLHEGVGSKFRSDHRKFSLNGAQSAVVDAPTPDVEPSTVDTAKAIEGGVRVAMIFHDLDPERRVRLLRYANTMLTELKKEAQEVRNDERKATA